MKFKYNQILYFFLIVVSPLLIYSCATIAMPSGGPKDVAPPRAVKSEPPNHSINFDQKRVRIFFDEYVYLNDVNNQVIISPPPEEMPEFRLKGKSIVVEFSEDFKENTTYTVFLGNAITDITESNIISNFEYVFSTGNEIDSLSIRGEVLNAFTNLPEKDVLVMLYKETYDSIPYKEKPYYITRTQEDGSFSLNNLDEGEYKLFALMDANYNFLYDLPNEAIAFADTLIQAEYFPVFNNDTTKTDSLIIEAPIIDTIVPMSYQLYLFEERDTLQNLLRAFSPIPAKMQFIFRSPTEEPVIRVLNKELKGAWYIEDFNSGNDTLSYWVTNPDIDSLLIEFSDKGIVIDTVEIVMARKKSETQKIRKKDIKNADRLLLKPNCGRTFDYFQQLMLSSSYPIIEADFSEILLIEELDTLNPEISFADKIKTKLVFNYKFKENTDYQLFIPDSVLTDLIKRSNDTIIINFKTNSVDDFGLLNLEIKLRSPGVQYIIQLLNEKDAVIKQDNINSNTKIVYKNLSPGKYILKAVNDKNNNSKWDTGKYLQYLQPERVYFFPSKINIRSKWEIEELWEL